MVAAFVTDRKRNNFACLTLLVLGVHFYTAMQELQLALARPEVGLVRIEIVQVVLSTIGTFCGILSFIDSFLIVSDQFSQFFREILLGIQLGFLTL